MNGGSSDRRYTRDKNGRVTGITNVRTPSLAGLNATLDYAAENNRLQSVIGANAGTYAYDANGNTLSDSIPAGSASAWPWPGPSPAAPPCSSSSSRRAPWTPTRRPLWPGGCAPSGRG